MTRPTFTPAELTIFAEFRKGLRTSFDQRKQMLEKRVAHLAEIVAESRGSILATRMIRYFETAIDQEQRGFDALDRLLERIAAMMTTADQPTASRTDEAGPMTADAVREIGERCECGTCDLQVRPLRGEPGCLIRLADDRFEFDAEPTGPYVAESVRQFGRWWHVSSHATTSEVVQTIWLAWKTFEEHEMREEFTYRGESIYHPHQDAEALAEMIDDIGRDVRPTLQPNHAAAAMQTR